MLLALFFFSQTDHQARVLVVDHILTFGIFIPELSNVSIFIEVVITILVDLAIIIIVLLHAVLPLRDPFLDAVEQSVRIDYRTEIKSLIVHYACDLIIRAIA